jgi:exopolysaccharide production protein ExoF
MSRARLIQPETPNSLRREKAGAFLAAKWIFLLLLCLGRPAAAHAEEYRLGPQDKIRVSVVEWFPATNELRSPLTGEYTVSPAGMISLPLLGDTSAAGLDPPALANAISEKLQAKLSLTELPTTSVEIIEFGPFYVLGEVERPGGYPYRPGLTVLRCVSLAGGFYRINPAVAVQAERDAATARANLQVASTKIDELRAREARLNAEFSGTKTVEFPTDMVKRKENPSTAQLLRLEETIFEARRRVFETGLESERNVVTLSEKEFQALQGQGASLKRQEDSIQRQAENQRSLQAKGLTVSSREFDLDRILADVEVKQRDLESRAFRAQQDRGRAEAAAHNAENRRREEIASELQQVQAKLGELWQQAQTAQAIATEAERVPGKNRAFTFNIVRKDLESGSETEITASESTPIRPGDVLRVHFGSDQPYSTGPGRSAFKTGALGGAPRGPNSFTGPAGHGMTPLARF